MSPRTGKVHMTPEQRLEKIEATLEVVTTRLVEIVDVQREQAQAQRRQASSLLELTEKLDAMIDIAGNLQRSEVATRAKLAEIDQKLERLRPPG